MMFHAHCCLTWPNRELLRQRSLDEFQHGVNHKLLALSKAWLYTQVGSFISTRCCRGLSLLCILQLAVLVIQTPLRMQVQRWLFRVSTAQVHLNQSVVLYSVLGFEVIAIAVDEFRTLPRQYTGYRQSLPLGLGA